MEAHQNQTQDETIFEWLATYSLATDIDQAPDAVRTQAALCLLDTVGCIIAGSQTPEARALYRAESALHGDLHDWPAEVSARVLGFLGDILELNDLIGGHSSIGVVPAVLAEASGKRISGATALRAITVGTEVTARLYESSVGNFKPYSDGGTVIVSYFNAIGAAAALSITGELDGHQTANAMAISSTLNSWCPAEVIFGQGGTIKPMLFGGNPASSAIQAVNYARHGFTGPLNLVESPIGLMTSLATGFDPGKLRDPQRWFITTPQRKLHASCGYTHSSIDAVASMNLTEEQIGGIEAIDVAVPEFFKEAVGKVGAPKSSNDARFHLGYVVALALQGRYPILPEHTLEFEDHLSWGKTLALSEKVRIVPTDNALEKLSKPYNVSQVTVHLSDGNEVSSTCWSPRGSAENPLTDGEVIEKFHRLTVPLIGEAEAHALATDILGIDENASISELVETVYAVIRKELTGSSSRQSEHLQNV